MTEKILEVQVSDETRKTSPADCKQFAEKIHAELSYHTGKIEKLLYPQDPRGQIEYDSISIEDSVETEEDGSGWFCVAFTETAHYGCSDMNVADDRYDDFKFTYDRKHGVIKIPMPDEPEYTGE